MEISTLVLPSVLSDVGTSPQVYDLMASHSIVAKSHCLHYYACRWIYLQCEVAMGGNLWGTVLSQNLRWGTAHVFVPPIFREVVLLDACESTNWVKRGVIKAFFVLKWRLFSSRKRFFSSAKGHIYIRFKTVKKVIRNFWRQNGNFFPKNRSFWNFVPRNLFPSLQTRRQVSAYWSSRIAWIIFLLAIHCFVVGLLYVMLLYGYLNSASHRRLFIGALSVTGRWKEGSSNYVDTQVISPVASNSGVQKECHSRV